MKAGAPSRTAAYMALFRALESERAQGRLFDDPFAKLFLPPGFEFLFRLSQVPVLGRIVPHLIDVGGPGSRSSGIARTRFIDDHVRAALADGVEQVVIVGAGFDCRAHRIDGMARVRVFEVDHPDTLAEKQRRLRSIFSSSPAHVRYVAVDFNRVQVSVAMAGSGYDPARRTCFIWEGVTHYLSAAAVDVMFRWFAGAVRGSVVIFTYIDRRIITDPNAFLGGRRLLRRVEELGEPWVFGFDPAEVGGYLAARGLELVDDLGASGYRPRYWGDRKDGRRGYEFYHAAVARVS